MGLRPLRALEEGSGAVATVKGQRITIVGGSMWLGKAPSRYPVRKLGAQVLLSVEGKKWRGHMIKVTSGVYIPTKMTSGASLAAREQVVEAEPPVEATRALALLWQ